MMTLFLLLIFAGVAAGCWFQGLWPCAISVINLTFAALLATMLWEPACNYLEENVDKSYTYVYDFLLLWIFFGIFYALLRAITDGISVHRVEFHPYVELGGRTFLSLWCGWLFLCFATFTLQTAPIQAEPLGAWATPADSTFLSFSPDVQWAAFAQNRSRFALARAKYSNQKPHVIDEKLNVEAFDPQSDFVLRYHDRRKKFERMESLATP